MAEPAEPANANVKELAQSHNEFAFDLFARLMKTHTNENVFISPTSAALALAMVGEGAKGQTHRELVDVLHAGNFGSNVFSYANKELIETLVQSGPAVQLEIANSIWASRDTLIKPDFLTRVSRGYGASAVNVNLTDPLTATRINEWASSKTHGKIREIVNGAFSDETKMLVLDAVYFKGTWESKFDNALTKNSSFWIDAHKKINHPSMVKTGDFEYADSDTFQAVYLPYVGDKFGMYVFLPSKFKAWSGSVVLPDGHEVFATATNLNSASRFAGFFKDLNAQNWKWWTDKFHRTDGTLELPKFKLDLTFDLKQPLSDLGMQTAFHMEADFSGISEERTRINEFKQKTFVEVNEEGTEAAAVTFVSDGISIGIHEPFRMVV
ncbi:MAG: serpin family protein, partial [Limisphaerales bacterium]